MKVDSDATWNKYVAGSALCRAEFSTVRAGSASLTVLPDRGSAIMGGVTTADPDSVLPDVKPAGASGKDVLLDFAGEGQGQGQGQERDGEDSSNAFLAHANPSWLVSNLG